ncbi:MAG: Crp/Fnr family transcriptional regulator [Sphaerochaetaceae bacterium]
MQQLLDTQYHELILRSPLFAELSESELPHMLNCLNARQKEIESGVFIIRERERVEDVGVVLKGKIMVITEDIFGNRSINAKLGPGDLFGQVAASREGSTSPVSVITDTDCTIMWLSFSTLVRPCEKACAFHSRVIENMMGVLSQRNLLMSRKLAILSQRTTRDKLLAFLSWQSQDQGSNDVVIPYTREELADFLCVNRSALSREISLMVEDGLIQTKRNHFIIYEHLDY